MSVLFCPDYLAVGPFMMLTRMTPGAPGRGIQHVVSIDTKEGDG